ncbi:MAG: cyanophycinase [Gemmatimonadota bacterium]
MKLRQRASLPPDHPGRRPAARVAALLAAALLLSPAWAGAQETTAALAVPRVGPLEGVVLAAGGGTLGPEIWARFVDEAGGEASRIVLIPTAATDEEFAGDPTVLRALSDAGATSVVVLHTRDRTLADSESFVAPLREATGVWISGGRQHRLVEAYLDTRVQEALFEVLQRGGIVGGSSAGASILASFLVRGDPETNERVMSAEYRTGFGFLDRAAVDQHLLARGRQEDLWSVLDLRPELLGIGVDEGTAVVVQGDVAEVLGTSQVIFYDATGPERRRELLEGGDLFDLLKRIPLTGDVNLETAGAAAASH